MKIIRTFFFLFIIFFSQNIFAGNLTPTNLTTINCKIGTPLRISSLGEDVKCLQSIIGAKVDGRFGPLTKASVVAWQLAHGLSPDGIVGPKTREILNRTVASTIYPSGCLSFVGYSRITGVKCDTYIKSIKAESAEAEVEAQIAENEEKNPNPNPNLTNMEQFINAVVSFSREQGLDEQKLALISSSLREEIANSKINYDQEFQEMLSREAELSHAPTPFFDKIKTKLLSFLGATPKIAQAAAVPFGGTRTFTFYCVASGNWIIYITPLPPSFATLLSYYSGTQGFASYNIPFSTFLLGSYEPPGVCSYGTVNIPTWGTITPMVGSSSM
jgi:peptidoglycan hydrolase-like protein with peptidoglycan-binding domain